LQEIYEDCGYKVNADHALYKVKSFSMHTIFYTEVNSSIKTGVGGGCANEGEEIELFELSESQIKDFMNDDNRGSCSLSCGFCMSVMTF
jgi:hypothetical protein